MPVPCHALKLLVALLAALLAPCLAGCGAGGFIDDLVAGATDGSSANLPETGSVAAMSEGERLFATEVLRLVNEERAKVPLAPLQWDESAAAVAHGHSRDMQERSFFAHVNPSGQDPGARMIAGGMAGYSGWSENIARGQETPAAVMNTWMNSQGHRDNILRATFTHLGIGVHSTNDIWWTQLFVSR